MTSAAVVVVAIAIAAVIPFGKECFRLFSAFRPLISTCLGREPSTVDDAEATVVPTMAFGAIVVVVDMVGGTVVDSAAEVVTVASAS